jgi:hypothetical protein
MAFVHSMVDEAPFARPSWRYHTGVFAVFRCVVGALLTISGLLQLFGLPGEVRVWTEAVGRVALGIALMAAPSIGRFFTQHHRRRAVTRAQQLGLEGKYREKK